VYFSLEVLFIITSIYYVVLLQRADRGQLEIEEEGRRKERMNCQYKQTTQWHEPFLKLKNTTTNQQSVKIQFHPIINRNQRQDKIRQDKTRQDNKISIAPS
jgi:hypothetical protein